MFMNWMIFGILVIVLYIGNYLLEKIFLRNDKKRNDLKVELHNIKSIKVKTMEQQNRYLDLMDEKNKMFGNPFGKFMFYLLMFICYSIMLDYLPGMELKILSAVLYTFLIPLAYLSFDKKNEYRAFNYWSAVLIFAFFCSFMVIQTTNPLEFLGFRVSILMLLPLFLLFNYLIEFIKRQFIK